MRLHTGHCPSYRVYSGSCSPFAPKSTRTITTRSGLAVCLLLFFFFIYLGKRLSQKRLGVRPKYGWTQFFSLVYGLAFHFPGTFSLQNGSSPRSSCLLLLSTNINIPKVCFFLMWWSTLICSLGSSTHGFKAVLLLRPHGKGCFLPIFCKRSCLNVLQRFLTNSIDFLRSRVVAKGKEIPD